MAPNGVAMGIGLASGDESDHNWDDFSSPELSVPSGKVAGTIVWLFSRLLKSGAASLPLVKPLVAFASDLLLTTLLSQNSIIFYLKH